MAEKVYLVDNRATFICPLCSQREILDVRQYVKQNTAVEIELKCKCGYAWISSLERRRLYRKPVNFRGRYKFSNEVQMEEGLAVGKFIGKGRMQVVDLSVRGLKIKLKKRPDLNVNDRISVEFRLNDKKRTLIRENTSVKSIRDHYIGGAFSTSASDNASLGFYLLR